MRDIPGQKVLAVAATALILASADTATMASAHPAPFSVTAGSAPADSTVGWHASTMGSHPQVLFTDLTTGVSLACNAASLNGHAAVGTHASGQSLMSHAQFDGLNCTGPAGWSFSLTGFGTWQFDVTDVTNGVATGTLTNVRLHMESTNNPPPACSFDIAANDGDYTSSGTSTTLPGSLDATYANATQTLRLLAPDPEPYPSHAGNLALWNVEGDGGATYCIVPVIFNQGDAVALQMTFKIAADDPSYRPIQISS